ncbi:hypothetical protein [Nostoc sp. JL33]|uniref:hypothetical protein n=1 Tax=Nostoc sp. JL33 TaxID=2815396 RepID=UPI0025FCD730|nr:hypothetical protein [Nostoc sp. JL33]MBN3871261.1 hypothetical protein [Nostoc sp. JL33]
MISSEPNNINTSKTDGIRIEITRPHPLLFPTSVYPIPQKESGVNVPIQLYVSVINDSSTPFYINLFQSFVPELVTLDERIIQQNLVTEEIITNTQLNKSLEYSHREEVGWWQIKPESSFGFRLAAKLFWQNNSLQLKISSPANYVFGSTGLNYFWCFDDLQANTYQLRFILTTEFQARYASKSDIITEKIARETSSKILATSWVNLRLVHPLSTDNNAIEVDGIVFKVEMQKSVLNIPARQTGTRTDVKLCIHIMNNLSTALCFYQVGSLKLTLIGEDGKEISFGSDPIKQVRDVAERQNYYLVQPKESEVFDLDGMLFWEYDQLKLAISNKYRHYFTGKNTFDYFIGLNAGGSYQLQVVYHFMERGVRQLEEQVLEKVWTGWVAMPFVEFRIVEP